MKGIILAGGKGSRLYPMTRAVSKPLIPIYDKPMVYYPLSVLLMAGIRDIMLITAPADCESYRRLLGDGSQFGIHVEYGVQPVARGIADAFLIAEEFIGGAPCCLVLGDNMFHGQDLTRVLGRARERVGREGGAVVFGYPVKDARAFGVVEFDGSKRVVGIEEKPERPKSSYAVPGLYFYDGSVCDVAAGVEPSERGELEITSVNNAYLAQGRLSVELMGRGMAWLDTGTPEGMLKAAEYVEAVQSRQGYYIACVEEIAYRRGFIGADRLRELGESLAKTAYGAYLLSVADEADGDGGLSGLLELRLPLLVPAGGFGRVLPRPRACGQERHSARLIPGFLRLGGARLRGPDGGFHARQLGVRPESR